MEWDTEIKFRYVFKRKSDGHIYMIESKIEALEEASNNGLKSMLKNDLWELVNRDRFTGLKDKKGTDIFENDVLNNWDELHIVRYGEQQISHDWSGIGFFTLKISDSRHQDNSYYGMDAEVIGDVHNTPGFIK